MIPNKKIHANQLLPSWHIIESQKKTIDIQLIIRNGNLDLDLPRRKSPVNRNSINIEANEQIQTTKRPRRLPIKYCISFSI
jgi:hypothetical protein